MSFCWTILSNTTLSPLLSRLQASIQQTQTDAHVRLLEYGEVYSQIFNSKSELYTQNPQLITLYFDLEVLKPDFALNIPFLSSEDQKKWTEEIVMQVLDFAKALRSHSSATLLINSFPITPRTPLGIGLDPIHKKAVRLINEKIAQALYDFKSCFIYDFDALWAETGHSSRDRRFESIAQFPLSLKMQDLLIGEWMRFYRSLRGLSRKCVIVDLDNTLWGGILGEEGLDQIQIGDTPEGKSFRRFQTALKALQRRGILLAIASKNNLNEVLNVLRNHPDMVLRESDFACMEVNWQDKASNLKSIQQKLNIGFQHMVFLDDNPSERLLVKNSLPEILVPDLGEDPSRYADVLLECELDSLSLSDEDRFRTEMLHAERQREASRASAPTFEDFLKQLEISVEIESFSSSHWERAFQLFQKTNQFNLTTKRYTEEEIHRFYQSPEHRLLLMRVTDRFGKYGWTGLALVKFEKECADIDSLLMSCRILGKNVEFALFDSILNLAKQKGCKRIRGHFIPTSKNAPCSDFYSKCGLPSQSKLSESEKIYESDIAVLKKLPINHIKMTIKE